jgi:hypothetical protein
MIGVFNWGFYACELHGLPSIFIVLPCCFVLIKQHFGETFHIRKRIWNPRTDHAVRVYGLQVAV